MTDSARFALFLAASAALIVTPGPGVLYIVTRSLAQGRRAGLVSVLGMGLGNSLHALAAALGLAALLASSPFAFSAAKYLGAGYLIFLGVRRLWPQGKTEGGGGEPPREGHGTVFRDALLVSVTNPKTALFFLAFLPQFATPREPLMPQMLRFGAIFVGLAVASDSAYATLASSLGGWLRRRPGAAAGGRWLSALVYLGLGLLAAFAGEAHP